MQDLEKYKGIIPAFYSCYDDSGNISAKRIKKLSRFYLDKGVKGLFIGGSTGEMIFHSINERKAVLDHVMDEVGGKLTVIAHIAAPSTKDSINLARHAQIAGADAIAAIPGLYYSLNEIMVENYWKDILNSQDLNMIIYNIPQTTGFSLSLKLFYKMLQTKKIIGVKNSSLQPYDIQQYKALGGDDTVIFNGTDEQFIAGRVMGAEGGIGATYGIMPELFLKLDSLIRIGDIKTASSLQFVINNIIYDLFTFSSFYASIKEVLLMRGMETGGVRLPFLPIENTQKDKVKTIYEKIIYAIDNYCDTKMKK